MRSVSLLPSGDGRKVPDELEMTEPRIEVSSTDTGLGSAG